MFLRIYMNYEFEINNQDILHRTLRQEMLAPETTILNFVTDM